MAYNMHIDELAQLEVNLRTLQRRLVQTFVVYDPKEMSRVRAEIEVLEEQRADLQSRMANSFDVDDIGGPARFFRSDPEVAAAKTKRRP